MKSIISYTKQIDKININSYIQNLNNNNISTQ